MKLNATYQKRSECINFWNWLLIRCWCVNKNGDREWAIGIFGFTIFNELED